MPIFAAFMVAAPEMLAVEAAAVTAAEIAAAEAAAAAAAEAAAVAAAEQAAAATAAEAAVTQAGLTAAEQAAQAGIMEVGGATANAASAPITTAEAVQAAAQQSGVPEVVSRGIQSVPDVMSPAQRAYLEASTASVGPGSVPGANPLPAYPNNFIDPNTVTNVTAGVPGDISNAAMRSGMDPAFASGPTPSDADDACWCGSCIFKWAYPIRCNDAWVYSRPQHGPSYVCYTPRCISSRISGPQLSSTHLR
jgi:colicin import membrane protein